MRFTVRSGRPPIPPPGPPPCAFGPQFYDGDARRRPSAEIELGTEWRDVHDARYEVNWIEDTGELYVMREPIPHIREDPFGGQHYSIGDTEEKKMTVHVVAQIESLDSLHQILDGWAAAMAADGGAEWLAERLRTAGVAVGTDEPLGDDEADGAAPPAAG
jgi:hypothetical protein